MTKILSFLFFFISGFALPQSIELRDEFLLTSKLFKDKRYYEAITSNNKALLLSINEFGENHLTTATLYENKGRLYLKIKDYYSAEVSFKKVIEIRKKLMEFHDPNLAEAFDYLAISFRNQGKYQPAMEMHNKVLSIMAKVIGNNPGQITELSRKSALYRARAFRTKGDILIKEGKAEEALGNYKTAAKIFERTLGFESSEFKEVKKVMESKDK